MNEEGLDLLKSSEGLRLKAYLDVAGHVTIGYGHKDDTMAMGDTITMSQAQALLEEDLIKFQNGVSKLVQLELNSNQFSALVDFAYNLGLGALAGSHLLKKLNIEDYTGAADEFLKWNHAAGVMDKGLTQRRERERALFLKPV